MSDKGSINNITLPVYKKLKAECSVVRTETSITELSDVVLSKLKCGDIVCKEDSSGKHSYIVSYKKDNTGICLTYADGSGYIETVSYDYTGGHWVYNSTDVARMEDYEKKADLHVDVEDALIGVQDGTPVKVIGINSDDELCKGAVSGGTKLYMHTQMFTHSNGSFQLKLISDGKSPMHLQTGGGPSRFQIDDATFIINVAHSKHVHFYNDKSIYSVYEFSISGTSATYTEYTSVSLSGPDTVMPL